MYSEAAWRVLFPGQRTLIPIANFRASKDLGEVNCRDFQFILSNVLHFVMYFRDVCWGEA